MITKHNAHTQNITFCGFIKNYQCCRGHKSLKNDHIYILDTILAAILDLNRDSKVTMYTEWFRLVPNLDKDENTHQYYDLQLIKVRNIDEKRLLNCILGPFWQPY